MRYRRLLVGRVRPLLAFAVLIVMFGSVWGYVEWLAAQRRARLEAAFDPVQRALMEGMLSNPDLSATLPDVGFSRTKFDLRVQAALLTRRLYAAEIEIPGLRASLALALNEMDTMRQREQATATELVFAKKQMEELKKQMDVLRDREGRDEKEENGNDRLAGPENLLTVRRANKQSERAQMDAQNAQLLTAAFPKLTESLKPADTIAIVARVQTAVNSWLKARGAALESLSISTRAGTCNGYLCTDGILGEATKNALKEISHRDRAFWPEKVSENVN